MLDLQEAHVPLGHWHRQKPCIICKIGATDGPWRYFVDSIFWLLSAGLSFVWSDQRRDLCDKILFNFSIDLINPKGDKSLHTLFMDSIKLFSCPCACIDNSLCGQNYPYRHIWLHILVIMFKHTCAYIYHTVCIAFGLPVWDYESYIVHHHNSTELPMNHRAAFYLQGTDTVVVHNAAQSVCLSMTGLQFNLT